MAETTDRDANSALRDRLAEVYGRYERLRSEMDDLQRRLAAMRVSAVSADGLVRATVDPRGQLVDLIVDKRAAGDVDRLARAIVATTQDAAQRAAGQVEAMLADRLPPDSGTRKFLRDNDFGTKLP